jgi:hypothetical protein
VCPRSERTPPTSLNAARLVPVIETQLYIGPKMKTRLQPNRVRRPGSRPPTVGEGAKKGCLASAECHFCEEQAEWQSLPVSYRLGSYFFCHAGIRPGVPLRLQDSEDRLWGVDGFLILLAPRSMRSIEQTAMPLFRFRSTCNGARCSRQTSSGCTPARMR